MRVSLSLPRPGAEAVPAARSTLAGVGAIRAGPSPDATSWYDSVLVPAPPSNDSSAGPGMKVSSNGEPITVVIPVRVSVPLVFVTLAGPLEKSTTTALGDAS